MAHPTCSSLQWGTLPCGISRPQRLQQAHAAQQVLVGLGLGEKQTLFPQRKYARHRTDRIRTWRLSICCFPAQQGPIYNSEIPRSEPSFAIIAHVVHTHVCPHCTPGDQEALPPTSLAAHLAVTHQQNRQPQHCTDGIALGPLSPAQP